MGYPKGKKRPPNAGRKKGTPNKSTVRMKEMVDEYIRNKYTEYEWDKFDPVLFIADSIVTEQMKKKPDRDFICHQAGKLMPYYHPQRKAIEIEPGEQDLPSLKIILTKDDEIKS